MPSVEIYFIDSCPYCINAKSLLRAKKAFFTDHYMPHLSTREINAIILKNTYGASQTVPAIWIKGRYVGGCDELMALERDGDLDRMLGCEI